MAVSKTVLFSFVGVFAVAAAGGYAYTQNRSAAPGGAPVAAAPAGTSAPSSSPPGGAPGKGGPGTAPASGPPPVTVEAARVKLQSLAVSITAVGSLRSDESVTLRPESAGRISEILFREGDRVARGKVLIRFDASVPRAEMEQAAASLTLARSKFERTKDLEKKGFVSQQARDEAESTLRVSEAATALAAAKLAKFEVRAPFAGTIGLRSVSVGDYVKEGQDMVNLESLDTLKVDFRVPEIYLTQAQVGQVLQFSLEAMPGKNFEGKVFAINPLIDAGGRSLVLRASVRNPNGVLRPGMFARVRLLFDDKKEALVVPETALVPQGTDQFVFKVVEGRAQRTRVEIGQRRDSVVEILGGVVKDDLVVTAGQLKLREATPVRVAGPGGPPSGTPPAAVGAGGAGTGGVPTAQPAAGARPEAGAPVPGAPAAKSGA